MPAPLTPSEHFFAYLVELGDIALDAVRVLEASHWYEQACEHAPALGGQTAETFEAFVCRARNCDDDLHERMRYFRAACGVVLSRCVKSPEGGPCNDRGFDVGG